MASPIQLLDLARPELSSLFATWGFSAAHAARLWRYLYRDAVGSLEGMSELPPGLRARLAQETSLGELSIARETHSSDGFTRKYLLGLEDGRQIETVLMKFTRRVTACLSTQVGCAMGCVFCATGQMGFLRQLSAGEIVSQVLHGERVLRAGLSGTESGPANNSPRQQLRNIVLMGMGEPLHNYEAVLKAVEILRDQAGLAIAPKHITLSTVGVIPGIIRLADEAQPFHLAVSLHCTTQAERAALIPVARAWPLDALLDACRYYVSKLRRRIFFEWALIAGKNDSPEQAHALGKLLGEIPAHVNLIPLNPTDGYAAAPTPLSEARAFQEILRQYDIPSTVRSRRGIDIAAGCGQLVSRL